MSESALAQSTDGHAIPALSIGLYLVEEMDRIELDEFDPPNRRTWADPATVTRLA